MFPRKSILTQRTVNVIVILLLVFNIYSWRQTQMQLATHTEEVERQGLERIGRSSDLEEVETYRTFVQVMRPQSNRTLIKINKQGNPNSLINVVRFKPRNKTINAPLGVSGGADANTGRKPDQSGDTGQPLRTVHNFYGKVSAEQFKEALKVNYSNPHDFKYIINPGVKTCGQSQVFILTYVHSSPEHYKRRSTIRETWGNTKLFPELQMRMVFLIGKSPSKTIQDSLLMESDRFNDIIQEDYLDSYRNLTYKGIQGLKWMTTYCRQARFVLKSDDDIFINIFSLVKHMKSLERYGIAKRAIICHVWTRMKVMRDVKSKWYISPEEYKDDYYPKYCSGSAFLFTGDIVPEMYEISKVTPFFWVDDFYITGLLPSRLENVKHEALNKAYYFQADLVEKFTGPQYYLYMFAHLHGLDKFYYMWNIIFEKERGKKPS